MKKIIIAGLVAMGAAACTPTELQTSQTLIAAGITAACNDVMAAEKAAPNAPQAPWANAACASAPAVASLVQNSATIQWLGQLQAQLAAAKAAAAPAAPAPAASTTAPS